MRKQHFFEPTRHHLCTSLFVIILASQSLVACSSLQKIEQSLFKNSTLHHLNPAPVHMAPPEYTDASGPDIDSTFMQSKADYHFTLAEAYSLDGRTEEAIAEFKHTLIYDPNSAQVRMRLAAEYIRQGLLSESIEQTEMAVESEPDNVDARLLLGGLYSSLKMFDLALSQYKEILKTDKKNTDAPIFIGAILAEKKQFVEAIGYFDRLTKDKSYQEPEKAWYYIGRIYLERDENKYGEKAKSAFLKSIQEKPSYIDSVMALALLYEKQEKQGQSLKLLESFQEKFGPNREVGKHLSRAYLEKEEYGKALKQLEIIESFDGGNLNVKLQLALIMIELKKYEEAATRLEDILVEAPDSDRIRYYLGAVYEQLKDYNEAVIHFSRVPSSSAYFAESVILSANIHREMGDQKKAANLVEEAISFRNDIPQFYSFYAALLDELKQYQKAVSLLNDAVDRFPSHTQIRFFLGSMHDRLGDTDKTIEHMKKVIEIDQNHVQALNYLAFTYAEKNINLSDAEAMARKALSAKPDDGYILDTLGWVIFKQGDFTTAVKYLEQAYSKANEESVIVEHLADVYTRLELTEKAVKLYQKALTLEKDAAKAGQIQEKLSALQGGEGQGVRLPASSEKPAAVRPAGR